MSKNNKEEMQGEDSTKYGEFISSFFSWIPLDKQKAIAEKLNKLGKTNKSRGD